MSEAAVSPVGYYLVSSDSEGRDAYYAWAGSRERAFELGRHLLEEPELAVVRREPEADRHRALFGGRAVFRPGRPSVEAAKALRELGWGDPDERCAACDLCSWEELPTSRLCVLCERCGACGHEGGCEEAKPVAKPAGGAS